MLRVAGFFLSQKLRKLGHVRGIYTPVLPTLCCLCQISIDLFEFQLVMYQEILVSLSWWDFKHQFCITEKELDLGYLRYRPVPDKGSNKQYGS